MKHYSAYIFDFDGVIKDSVKVKSEAFVQLFESEGKEFQQKVEQYHLANGGISRYVKFKVWNEWLGRATSEDVIDELANNFAQLVIKKVVVSAPIKGLPEDLVINLVMGVNDHRYQGQNIVTAASCTTNCLAPVIDVLHRTFGIEHGSMTTIHDITNTQSILDEYHSDLRRARASSMSLIPTSTGSATAITEIFPELKGRLNGLAVRVPLANASLTDCVFELQQQVSVEQVNEALKSAADGRLKGILGFETRPLVSVDYTNDRRSGIVDGLSTMVINNTQVKLLIWYDNEIGYVNRMMELAGKIARSI